MTTYLYQYVDSKSKMRKYKTQEMVKFISKSQTSLSGEPIMPNCENCGAELSLNAKFCGICGAKQNPAPLQWTETAQQRKEQSATFAPPPPPPPPPTADADTPTASYPYSQVSQTSSEEQVIGTLLLRKPKSLGRYDTFTGVLTDSRFIIAQMTSEMLKDAAMQARQQAKAEGRGFFGQWEEQLKATFGYTKKYLSMEPQAILAETPGNFELDNSTIREIKVNVKHLGNQSNRDEYEIEIHSNAGKYEYRMDENSNFIDLIKKVYGDKVKMPFGHFSKTINIGF
jgi:hypothetical protein